MINIAPTNLMKENMELILKRENIDLPMDVLEKLSELACRSGKSLKCYMESVLTSKAEELNPSPSHDSWFDKPENMRIVNQGIRQLEKGEGRVFTASELKTRLGL